MAINFPKNPSTDDTYTYLTTTWKWNGSAWEKSAATETGNTEGTTGGIAYYEGKSSTIKGALNAFYDETNERVGIGTSGPTELLDVRGGITASGRIYASQGITSGGDVKVNGDIHLGTNRIMDGSGNPVFKIQDNNRFLYLGDTDGSANDTKIMIRDTHSTVVVDADNSIDLNTPTIKIKDDIEHSGDSNTKINFTADRIDFIVGGATAARISHVGGTRNPPAMLEAPFGITCGSASAPDYGNIYTPHGVSCGTLNSNGDIRAGGNLILTNQSYIKVEDDTESIYLNAGGGQFILSATAVDIKQKLRHDGDSDTYIDFTPNNVEVFAGGSSFLDSDGDKTNIGGCTAGHGGFTASTMKVDGELILGGNIYLPEDGAVQIGGDTEKIVFNGAGSGSSSIDMYVTMTDFGQGNGAYLRSAGDSSTYLEFVNDSMGAGKDGMKLVVDDTVLVNMENKTAGITMDQSPVNFKTYTETKNAISDKSSNFDVTVSAGSVQTVKCTSGTIEVGFTGWNPATNIAQTVTLIIEDGGNINTWDSAVKWPSDVAPSLTADGIDIITFMTPDAGTTVYGFVGGLNFS